MNNNELTEKIEKLKQEIKNLDYILIGAGLSTSAGFLYDGKRFEDNFKDYIKNTDLPICIARDFIIFQQSRNIGLILVSMYI